MGTTLTGTTPQDTYDSLIKVTDNAPLTGSLKVLTDGLGNDSALALSTGAASVTGTLAVSGNATFDTNTLFVDAANNRVGVGTITPEAKLDIVGSAAAGSVGMFIENSAASTTNNSADIYFGTWGGSSIAGITNARISAVNTLGVDARTDLEFYTYDGASSAKRLSITSAGNVGIGTSSPSNKLSVGNPTADGSQSQTYAGNNDQLGVNANYVPSGTFPRFFDIIASGAADGSNGESNIRFFTNGVTSTTKTEKLRILANGGITFNGDTAAANALDDYEEGTWTMGVSFGSASVGVTYANNTGTYTKIGRQVTINGALGLTNKGSSTGLAAITGLPFTIANSIPNYSAASLYIDKITFANAYVGFGLGGENIIRLREVTEAGVISDLTDGDFVNDSNLIVSFTYFV